MSLLMQIALSAVGRHGNIGQTRALVFPWLFNITKANWSCKLMDNRVLRKRRQTKSKGFQDTVWFYTIWHSISGVMKTEYLPFHSLKLLFKGNAYNKHLYYTKNDSFLIGVGEIVWKCIFKVKFYTPLGNGANFFSDKHFTEKPERRDSDADRLVFEAIPDCTQQWNWT